MIRAAALDELHALSEAHWSRDTMARVDYYVVKVRDPGDPVLGLSQHEQRFEFRGEDAADLAWDCASGAIRAGFDATTKRVAAREPR